MNKKKIMIISVLIIILIVGIYLLYNTFAINTVVNNDGDTYTINLTENNNTSFNIKGNSSKTIFYHIKNTSGGTIRYGVGYTGSNIDVKVYSDSNDNTVDTISYGENKFVKLYIKNNNITDSTVTIKTILGYEHGGDLIVPSNVTLVTKTYIKPVNLVRYISELYNNNSKTIVINNDIEYNYATSVNLMNDRLGSTSINLDGGNIRYYGSNPSNYIYFNCSDYSNQTSNNCELWRIIGIFDGNVKIVRNSIIGNLSWDTSASTVNSGNGVNEWNDADLMKVLNPGYESLTIGGSLYYNGKDGSFYYGNNNGTNNNINFINLGIKNDITRNMIASVNWPLGGFSSSSIYSNQAYQYERETNVYNGRKTNWTGKIALMYMSDYGYATDFNKCNKKLIEYNDSSCTNNNWLFVSNFYFHLLSPNSNFPDIAWGISSNGRSSTDGYICSNTISVRPALYLKNDISKFDGDGSKNNPYKIKL